MTHSLPKAYLVTGAAGFIGARFVESCAEQKISVISVDHVEYFQSRPEHHKIHFGEKVDLEDLSRWIQTARPTLNGIVHLGAITDTRENRLDLLQKRNIEASKFLWDYASREKIPLVYASSAATYGDGSAGYDDDEKIIPQLRALNAYGDSKLQFDLWALAQEKGGVHPPNWAGFKFFNVYGYGEKHKGFMASVVLHAYEEIQKSGKVTLFKSHRSGIPDGFQKRDFVFVDDVVDVLHFALQKPISRGIFNLGTGQARSFLELAQAVFKSLHQPENVTFIDTPENIRDKYQYFTEARMDRLRSQGYTLPFSSLEAGVKKYIDCLKGDFC